MAKIEKGENIDQLVRDLEYVKAAVKRNYPILKETMSPKSFRAFMTYIGTGVITISLVFHFVIRIYGSFAASPTVVRWLLVGLVIVIALSASFLKFATLNRSARKIDRRMSVWTVFRDFYMPHLVNLHVPILLLGLGIIGYFIAIDRTYYIIGVSAITSALVLNVMSVHTRLWDYLAFGHWLFLTGILSLLFPGIPGGIWMAICFGGASYLFVAVSLVLERRSASRPASRR